MLPRDLQPYFEVAISVIKTKDIGAINKLKDFLQALPTPRKIERTLASAVLYFAQYDFDVFEWVLENQTALLPELDLFTFTSRRVRARLSAVQWTQPQHFELDLASQSLTIRRSIAELQACFPAKEWLLITALFEIRSPS